MPPARLGDHRISAIVCHFALLCQPWHTKQVSIATPPNERGAIRLRAEAIRTQTLVAQRDILTNQEKWLYAREPMADKELVELADKTMGEETAKELVAVAKKEREDVAKRRKAPMK